MINPAGAPAAEPIELLTGLQQIADHLGWTKRQAKQRALTGAIPTFRLGHTVCARRSSLNAWMFQCEAKALAEREGANGQRR